ncbi:MAG: dephospho-CoA kinase [Gammaproteobacteria bacterium]|nr:dephospho-CoA kinase [Gammaproteobacteria bacterium]
MLVIGLTGGIGTGKTTVARLFSTYGISCIDADDIGRELTQIGTPAYQAMLAYFGESCLLASGELNRKKIAEIIFHHEEKKEWLEKLLHPLILKEIEKKIIQIHAPYVLVAIPLLLEKGPFPFIQRVLLVDAPEHLQITRVIKRDRLTAEHAKRIVHQQMSPEERAGQADDVILNTSDEKSLAEQVSALHKKYLLI